MLKHAALALTVLLLAGCQSVAPPPAAAPVREGLVSAADPRAVAAGTEILRAGGSAADAAIAVMLALTVVEPQSSGIGGGSFIVTSDPAGQVESYDGRETAPRAAGPDWFMPDGEKMPGLAAVKSGRSVGVPGNMRLAAQLHADKGRLPWASLFAPAIRLADEGFAVTERLHGRLERYKVLAAHQPAGLALYYGADGAPKPVGTRIVNADLARALTHLAEEGAEAFYRGDNAARIVASVNATQPHASAMTLADLADYEAKRRTPVCGHYRNHRICGMGPPSSGATTVFAILKQLERFDLAALGPREPMSWHLIAESMKLAWADRNAYLGDPDFIDVPLKGLTDTHYLARRSMLIDRYRAMDEVPVGAPEAGLARKAAPDTDEQGTSHFVIVDGAGHIVSQTSTIEAAFGSGLIVDGYYLNNELTDFNFEPRDGDGALTANRVEGGKRPRSSMSPTILFAPDGSPRLVIGAAGGGTIIAQVAKAIIGVVDWKLSAEDAIALPVIYAPGKTVFVERGTWLETMAPEIGAFGHEVRPRDPSFKANAAEYVDGRWVGAADPRSEGSWTSLGADAFSSQP